MTDELFARCPNESSGCTWQAWAPGQVQRTSLTNLHLKKCKHRTKK